FVYDLCVNNVWVRVFRSSACLCTFSSLCLVDLLAHFLRFSGQLFYSGLDCFDVIALQGFIDSIGSLVNLGLDCIVDLVRVLFQELTGLVSSVLRVVAGLLLFTTLLVLFSVCFCILNHAVDLFLGKTGTVLDLDGVFLAGALVLSGNGNDTVCVNVEGDLNLRHTARSRSDTAELKGTEQLVGRSHLALTLEDLNLYGRLVIFRSGEGFRLLGWNGGVALNQLGHHATLGFNTKRQWGDIQEQNVLNFTAQNASLKCCTHCNDLVWVNTLVWLAAGQLFNQLG